MVVCVCFFNIYLFLLSVGDIDQLILSDSKLREEKYNENKKYLHSVDDFNACKNKLIWTPEIAELLPFKYCSAMCQAQFETYSGNMCYLKIAFGLVMWLSRERLLLPSLTI